MSKKKQENIEKENESSKKNENAHVERKNMKEVNVERKMSIIRI